MDLDNMLMLISRTEEKKTQINKFENSQDL